MGKFLGRTAGLENGFLLVQKNQKIKARKPRDPQNDTTLRKQCSRELTQTVSLLDNWNFN